jgi:hypothetical protein
MGVAANDGGESQWARVVKRNMRGETPGGGFFARPACLASSFSQYHSRGRKRRGTRAGNRVGMVSQNMGASPMPRTALAECLSVCLPARLPATLQLKSGYGGDKPDKCRKAATPPSSSFAGQTPRDPCGRVNL